MECEVDFNHHLLSASETPPCEGPKLRAFPYAKDEITWIKSIDCYRERDAPRQAYVFKVKIRSRIYALKVFKFFKSLTYRETLGPIRGRMVTDEDLSTPHQSIQQAQQADKLKSRDIAKCYGFLALRPGGRDEDFLAREGVRLWDIPLDDPYRRITEGSPIRAIVKDYIEDEADFNVANLKRMLRGIKYINKHGVPNMDIHSFNYKAGLLIDFGSSWTKPHCIWDIVPADKAKGAEGADLQNFQLPSFIHQS
ncbi:kinetochore Sim4 complex subunit FTA2-domain-containing protein [Xylaria acuta]|nr:kinetochore Sim4 complex subunit FTA2-domain-containing protein [Xylaria acuta]